MSLSSEHREHTVRRLYVTAVALPIVLAAIAGAWLVYQIARIAEAADWIDTSDRVIAQVGEVQKILVDQELAVRAFLYTSDPLFLEAYLQASPSEDLDELELLLSGTGAPLAPGGETQGAAEVHLLRDHCAAFRRQAGESLAIPSWGRSVAALRDRRDAIDTARATAASIIARAKSTRLFRLRRFEKQARRTTVGAAALLAALAVAASISSLRKLRLIDALMKRERDALLQAQEALRAKDTFLANLSHELRTPLTPILWWVSMARAGRLRGEALDRALASIERNARAEAQLVDDVLDLSRIATRNLRVTRERVDLEDVVRAAIDAALPAALAKGVTIETHLAPDLPEASGDPLRLQQVVWNILCNAVKFTPAGGRVEVRLDRRDERLRVRVSDDGEGISPEFLPHVFEDFRQGDVSMTRAHGGLGIGLSIVKHLVGLHGGEVVAESEGPGRGATFTVTLPAGESPG